MAKVFEADETGVDAGRDRSSRCLGFGRLEVLKVLA
jgi:hypothetical protein